MDKKLGIPLLIFGGIVLAGLIDNKDAILDKVALIDSSAVAQTTLDPAPFGALPSDDAPNPFSGLSHATQQPYKKTLRNIPKR